MTLAIKVVILVLVGLALLVVFLRVRKLRRDEMREFTRPLDRRLVAPPPSPYAPSKGFRLLDESGELVARPPVERPRLDPERHYVFSDSPSNVDELAGGRLRHNDDWFLTRSSHRSTLSIVSRRVGVVVLLALIVTVIVTYYGDRHHSSPGGSTSTTTSAATSTTTTTTTSTSGLPSSFLAHSVSGDDATYLVPAASYRVQVKGTRGATWAVYNMGANDTLEWQGTVAQGHDELLTMSGNARVTIGSPSNATVNVDGRPVIFPTPLPSTLILVFTSTPTS